MLGITFLAFAHLCLTCLLLHLLAAGWMPYEAFPHTQGDAADSRDLTAADARNRAHLLTSARFHFVMAALTFLTLRYFTTAPYGRHAGKTRLGWSYPARLAWLLQEVPTLLNVGYFILFEFPRQRSRWRRGWGDSETTGMRIGIEAVGRFQVSILLFVIHYAHRVLVYPLVVPPRASRVPVHVVWSATLYCLFNGRLQLLASLIPLRACRIWGLSGVEGGSLFHLGSFVSGLVRPSPPPASFAWSAPQGAPMGSPKSLFLGNAERVCCGVAFLIGMYLFFKGFLVNIRSDYYLTRLKRHSSEYQIPCGDWFERLSCPNFFGEMLEWTGYALVVGSCSFLTSGGGWGATPALAACSFTVYVFANLIPRGVAHHEWYLDKFGPAYAKLNRNAVLPGIL
ncbi:unnamed protein product [Phytomonas sp. EM1]|nr:unnamed protein product [Phytomonas sp. EM1]|eukprot:CCW65683.1 unnamed protein product [Phytomonas sp. isolate EM1]